MPIDRKSAHPSQMSLVIPQDRRAARTHKNSLVTKSSFGKLRPSAPVSPWSFKSLSASYQRSVLFHEKSLHLQGAVQLLVAVHDMSRFAGFAGSVGEPPELHVSALHTVQFFSRSPFLGGSATTKSFIWLISFICSTIFIPPIIISD